MFFKALILIVAFSSLIGCRQFSDDQQAATTQPVNATAGVDATVSGRANKGVLKWAVVTAYAIEDGGLRFLAETLTDAKGDFTMDLTGVRGPVLFELTVDQQAGSEMTCDAISGCMIANFGESIVLPADFSLTAVVARDELVKPVMAITPLTHIAGEWVRQMPGEVTAEKVSLSRERVADLLSVSPDFAFQRVPDITDQVEVEQSEANALGHAIMAAAFLENAIQQANPHYIDDVSQTFAGNGGQLPSLAGGTSLSGLLLSAEKTAAGLSGHSALASMQVALGVAREGLPRGLTRAAGRIAYDPQSLMNARSVVSDLGWFLEGGGINQHGDFVPNFGTRAGWLFNSSMTGYLQVVRSITGFSIILGLGSDWVPCGTTGELALSNSQEYRVWYNCEQKTLRATGLWNGQNVDISVKMPGLKTDYIEGRNYQLGVSAVIDNGHVQSAFDGSLEIDLLDTDMQPLLTQIDATVESGSSDNSAIFAELRSLLLDLQADVVLTGNGFIRAANRSDTDIQGTFEARIHLDVPAYRNNGNYLAVELHQLNVEGSSVGQVTTTDGKPLFSLTLGNRGILRLNGSAALLGFPDLEHESTIEFDNARALMRRPVEDINALTSQYGEEQLLPVTSGSPMNPVWRGNLNLKGVGVQYQVAATSEKLTLSQPNSTEEGIAFLLTHDQGGMLESAGEIVGTYSIDRGALGVHLMLADGATQSYRLASDDMIEADPTLKALADGIQ